MTYTIRILRRKSAKEAPSWQEFHFEGNGDASVAAVLNDLNSRVPLLDTSGLEAEPIAWERGCMVRKCGACAMLVNGTPRLACSTFLRELGSGTVSLAPLSKFPPVSDLIVDRSVIFERLKKMKLWLESDARMQAATHAERYASAKCILCGCCLEICPNFSVKGVFAGAAAPVNAYRFLSEEMEKAHFKEIAEEYRRAYFDGCGKSLACHDICPAGIDVEDLMVRSNAAAVWKKKKF